MVVSSCLRFPKLSDGRFEPEIKGFVDARRRSEKTIGVTSCGVVVGADGVMFDRGFCKLYHLILDDIEVIS